MKEDGTMTESFTTYPLIFRDEIVELLSPDPRYPANVFRVVKVARTKCTIEQQDGARWVIDLRGVRKTDREFVSTAPSSPRVYLGTVVRITDAAVARKLKTTTETLFVVFKHGNSTVNVARLGGDNDRYLRLRDNVIEVVDPSTITG
jgi:hypothetical protein